MWPDRIFQTGDFLYRLYMRTDTENQLPILKKQIIHDYLDQSYWLKYRNGFFKRDI